MQIDPKKVKWDEPEIDPDKVQWDDTGGIWEGLVKPTLKAIPKVAGTVATNLVSMPVAGLTGLGVGSLAALEGRDPWIEANKAMEGVTERGNMITTPEEQAAMENIGLAMKPFQMAGEGLQEIVRQTPLKDTIAEPIAGTVGEAAAMFGIPAKAGQTINRVRAKQLADKIAAKPEVRQAATDLAKSEMERAFGMGEEGEAAIPQEQVNVAPKEKIELTNEPSIAGTLADEPVNASPEGLTLYSNPVPQLLGQYTKYIGTPLWDYVVNQKIPQLLEKVPYGKNILRGLYTDYRGNLKGAPEFNQLIKDQRHQAGIGQDYAIDLGNRLMSVPEADQLKLGEFIRGETETLPDNLSKLGQETKDAFSSLGKQAVDTGLLNEKTFFEHVGRYMPRLYTKFEYQGLLNKYDIPKPNRLDLSRFQQRKDIPKEIREQMGEILTPGYPVAKGIMQLTHDISMARMFKGIADNPEWAVKNVKDVVVPEGYEQLPSNKKLGELSEAYVHPEIAREINAITEKQADWVKGVNKAYGAWKFGKVIMSPKTHMRNMMSNSILAHLGGMPMWEQPIYLTKAIKEMKDGGQIYQDVYKNSDIFRTGWAKNELADLYDQTIKLKGVSADNPIESVAMLREALSKGKDVANKMADIYQKEEQVFKMAKVIKNLEEGMDIKAAVADANKWLFDYSDVTRFQQKYRQSLLGAPFATFTFKALPRIAEAAVKTPWRFVAPYLMFDQLQQAAMEKFGDTKEQAEAKGKLRDDYMQGSTFGIPNFPRVPVTDNFGREYYLDLTYILPWGDIGQSGSFAGIPGAIRPLSHPVVNEAMQQIANYDTFFKQNIVKDSEVEGKSTLNKILAQGKERGAHLAQTILPTPAMDIQKLYATLTGNPDYRGREKPLGAVLADIVAGVKMTPVDYQDLMRRYDSKLNPSTGFLAREIIGRIKNNSVKAETMRALGKSDEKYQDAIEKDVEQLRGLGEELEKKSELYLKAIGQ